MSSKTGRLVILQTTAQSRHYLSNRRDPGDVVLPIGPGARYQADVHKWRTVALRDLWTAEEYAACQSDNQQRLARLIDALDAYSRRSYPHLDLEIGRYYAFQLWVIIGQVNYNHFIVQRIEETLRPESLLCYTRANPEPFLELRPDPDSVFAGVLGNSFLFDAERHRFEHLAERTATTTWRERVLSGLPRSIRKRLRTIRDRRQVAHDGSASHNLLLIGAPGEWIQVNGDEAFKTTFQLHPAPALGESEKTAPSAELLDLLNDAIRRDRTVPYDLSGLASAIQTDLKVFADNAGRIKALVKGYDAAVTCVLTFPAESFMAHMATTEGRPVVVWQHGEIGQSVADQAALYTELYYASDYFAYAPVVEKQYRAWIGKHRLSRVHTVGSIQRKIAWRGGDAVVYATGKWFKTANPCLPTGDPDSRLYAAHRAILDYLDGVASTRPVTFKANNTPRLNEVPYEYENIKVDSVTPFGTLLESAGVVILDTPATTLVEACNTKVPIFVLGGRSHYTEEFLAVVKRRVVWCEGTDELIARIDAYLKHGEYEANVNDTAYLRAFCGETTESETCQLVRSALLEITSRAPVASMCQ